MKKLVKENIEQSSQNSVNEGFQKDFHKWLDDNGIYPDHDPEQAIYELSKKVYDLERYIKMR